MTDPRRLVPRTDAVLADPRLDGALGRLGRALVKEAVVAAQQDVRSGLLAPDELVPAVLDRLPAVPASLRPVLNATGVLVHTNLGRAPLSVAARAAVLAAAGTTDVELDLASGRRGPRGAGALAALAAAVPDAGGVHVVNNGAAALVLAATALAAGREIVLSRGEMVEIGDGFRIPDLVASTGARLREVGTTNRVTLADYAAAVGPDTGFVLKLHPSNFVVSGFTAAVRGRAAGDPGRAAGGGHRLRAAGAVAGAARRAGRGHRAAGRRRAGHRERRQAARRPAGRAAAGPGRGGRAAAPAPAGPGAAGGQADAGRAGGDAARARGAGGPVPRRRPGGAAGRAERLADAAAGEPGRRDRGGQRGRGRRRRRARGGAAERGGEPAASRTRRRCGPAIPRCWAGSRAGAACWTCGRWTRPTTGRCSARSCPYGSEPVYVVATAGHVDHGKSTLVRALTGMEPDRWAEEKRRGMTLDLGFAWTRLPVGRGRVRRRAGARAVRADDAGRDRAGAGGAVRGRRRRRLDAAVDRAPGRAGRARRPARGARGDPVRPGRPGSGAGGRAGAAGPDLAGRRVPAVAVSAATGAGLDGAAGGAGRGCSRRCRRRRRTSRCGCGWTGRSRSGAAGRW